MGQFLTMVQHLFASQWRRLCDSEVVVAISYKFSTFKIQGELQDFSFLLLFPIKVTESYISVVRKSRTDTRMRDHKNEELHLCMFGECILMKYELINIYQTVFLMQYDRIVLQ